MQLIKDTHGNYYTPDNQYYLIPSPQGWEVHELAEDGRYRYSFTASTLEEIKMILKPK